MRLVQDKILVILPRCFWYQRNHHSKEQDSDGCKYSEHASYTKSLFKKAWQHGSQEDRDVIEGSSNSPYNSLENYKH